MDIKKTRENINKIDLEMAKLFEQRMKEVQKVAEYKKENGLPIFDEEREKEVIKKNSSNVNDPLIKEYYIDYIKSNMEISKKYQDYLLSGMKIAYCGVKGAFSYIAAKKEFPNQNLVSYPSFRKAYEAVEKSECDCCVLPIENSFAGDVGEVLDLIFSGSLFINNVIDLEIEQNLLGIKGSNKNEIKEIYSHPQAIFQCQDYIQKNNLIIHEEANTAIAGLKVKNLNNKEVGVIGSEELSSLYSLDILEKGINESRNNTTRFAFFTKTLLPLGDINPHTKHFILVFTVMNEAGSLAKTLNIIGSHGFNMRTLRSRPLKELIWNYYFFVELDGDVYSHDGQDMIKELSTLCDNLKIVGTYSSKKEK